MVTRVCSKQPKQQPQAERTIEEYQVDNEARQAGKRISKVSMQKDNNPEHGNHVARRGGVENRATKLEGTVATHCYNEFMTIEQWDNR